MSSHWTIYCKTCSKYGPDIRRSGKVSLQGFWPRYHPLLRGTRLPDNEEAQLAWGSFLNAHEYHRLELHHE